jgi:hypothetical protein
LDPVTIIVTALAIGASEGARETAKHVVVDGYNAIKRAITDRYATATADLTGLESEPEDPLRRTLLAQTLGKAGAGNDEQLEEMAKALLDLIAEHAPDAAQTVGVKLERIAATGDIEITDIAAQGGSGVIATDVTAGGSFKVSGVRAGSTQEPPHPSPARR